MEPDATNSLTNEQIARMLGYHGPVVNELGFHAYDRDVALCIRNILPEIVQRGYEVDIYFWENDSSVRIYKGGHAAGKWPIDPTDPPSIARAICEALVRVVGKS